MPSGCSLTAAWLAGFIGGDLRLLAYSAKTQYGARRAGQACISVSALLLRRVNAQHASRVLSARLAYSLVTSAHNSRSLIICATRSESLVRTSRVVRMLSLHSLAWSDVPVKLPRRCEYVDGSRTSELSRIDNISAFHVSDEMKIARIALWISYMRWPMNNALIQNNPSVVVIIYYS